MRAAVTDRGASRRSMPKRKSGPEAPIGCLIQMRRCSPALEAGRDLAVVRGPRLVGWPMMRRAVVRRAPVRRAVMRRAMLPVRRTVMPMRRTHDHDRRRHDHMRTRQVVGAGPATHIAGADVAPASLAAPHVDAGAGGQGGNPVESRTRSRANVEVRRGVGAKGEGAGRRAKDAGKNCREKQKQSKSHRSLHCVGRQNADQTGFRRQPGKHNRPGHSSASGPICQIRREPTEEKVNNGKTSSMKPAGFVLSFAGYS